jgi:ubiquinone/menaquinone biosynthesis C-methylase UbiE
MKLIKESLICVPDKISSVCKTYVPGMTEANWIELETFEKNNKCKNYHSTRYNDYFWANLWLQSWMITYNISDLHLLDIGCGTSLWPVYIKYQFPSSYVLGIDSEEFSFTTEVKKFAIKHKFDYELKNLFELNFKKSSFNIISIISTIEHASGNYSTFFRNVFDTIAPKGLVLITTDISDNFKNTGIKNTSMKKDMFNVRGLCSLLQLSIEDINFIVNNVEKRIKSIELDTRRNFLYIALEKE